MKKAFKILFFTIVSIAFITAFTPVKKNGLEIGKPIPDAGLKMLDVSGKMVSMDEVKGENGLLVIFSCNTCPYVKLSEARIKEMALLASTNKIGVMIINSNAARRDGVDSFDAMKAYSDAQGFTFNYVVDKNSTLANSFGATRTPECFLFDKSALAYHGAIDDNIKNAEDAKDHYLQDALKAVGSATKVKIAYTKSIGCSIKRMED